MDEIYNSQKVDHLPASLLNPLESVSDFKEICAQSCAGSHRSLWGHQKSQNKLKAALFLKRDDVKHTVHSDIELVRTVTSLFLLDYKNL